MRKLSVLDLAFFLTETESSPKHVAGLMLLAKPPGAPAGYARQLLADLKTFDRPAEPFNLAIRLLGVSGPRWEACPDFDIDEHVFYHRPKKSMTWQAVLDYVSPLHETVLNRDRPLWEYHLIDGVEGKHFAIYVKLHHAYADGVTMARWIGMSLSSNPEDTTLRPPWNLPSETRAAPAARQSLAATLGGLTARVRDQAVTAAGLAKVAAQQSLERISITRGAMRPAFNARNDTPLTGRPTPGRSIATAWLEMDEIRQLGRLTRSTLNDVALSCIDGAFHRYLEERGMPTRQTLSVLMPVNLRSSGREKAGNQVGAVVVELAPPGMDPYARLREVGANLGSLKQQLAGIPGDAIEQYSILVAVTGELFEKLGLTDRLPTQGHTLVSNLPGPAETLYLKGARLEQVYPLSLLLPGLHTNITLFSCGDILNIGIVATRDLPELHRLAAHIVDEFRSLQEAAATT